MGVVTLVLAVGRALPPQLMLVQSMQFSVTALLSSIYWVRSSNPLSIFPRRIFPTWLRPNADDRCRQI
ncbi:hypothetical protein RchiOBHm_Chr4g0399051 [Rosa chinensis]|uniref:Uncharacterized protein n=1 Tax=Rosa chinensis TaxID=74649 RepID=A0A2P6QSH0_ROSCH|nr:hypothetical protein RchiOBHm_Chr4g0399051 [Rosa chinensis]